MNCEDDNAENCLFETYFNYSKTKECTIYLSCSDKYDYPEYKKKTKPHHAKKRKGYE